MKPLCSSRLLSPKQRECTEDTDLSELEGMASLHGEGIVTEISNRMFVTFTGFPRLELTIFATDGIFVFGMQSLNSICRLLPSSEMHSKYCLKHADTTTRLAPC